MIKKICFVLFLCIFVFVSCSKNQEENSDNVLIDEIIEEVVEDEIISEEDLKKLKYENAIDEFVENLSLKEKIGQMFLVTIGGTEFYDSYYDSQSFVAPGGYLLFGYNFLDGKQTIEYTSNIGNWFSKNNFIKPYFSVDQEGGLVNRLRDVASPLPSAASVAKFLSKDLAMSLYDSAGKQLNALGIHVNLGPVVEILTDENEEFLGTRSFGDTEKVSTYSKIFIESMLKNNVYPVVKHFPGNNADDPHLGLPVIDFDYEKTSRVLLDSFRTIEDKDKLGVLVAHSVVPSLFQNEEDAIPSCLSKEVVTNLLKNQFGYESLIFSDDLLMAALQNNGYNSIDAISMAIKAGINVLMISQKEYLPFIDDIEKLCESDDDLVLHINESVKKIIDFKVNYGLLNYSEEKITEPKSLSKEELSDYQQMKYEEFISAYNLGSEFYQMYWGK